jgi:hypothetical protein
MDDYVTEGYNKLQRQGIIVNNGCVKTQTIREWFPGRRDMHVHLDKWGCSPARWYDFTTVQDFGDESSKAMITLLFGAIPWAAEPSLSVNEELALRELALTSAYANINSTDVLALVALAESEKTLVGLVNTFRRVLGITKTMLSLLEKQKRRASSGSNIGQLKRDLKKLGSDAQQLYMEARYGLRPLYYDVVGFSKFLTKPKPAVDRYTFRGKQVWSDRNSDIVVKNHPGTSGYYFTAALPFYRVTTKDVFVRAGVLTRFTDYGAIQGLGLQQIPETIWELTKFSFILDWFFNVGELIASWTPNLGFETLTSWVTQETVVTKTIVAGVPSITNLSNATYRVVDPAASFSYGGIETSIRYERIPRPKQPFSPHLNVKLNTLKLIDLAIILKQLKTNTKSLQQYRI